LPLGTPIDNNYYLDQKTSVSSNEKFSFAGAKIDEIKGLIRENISNKKPEWRNINVHMKELLYFYMLSSKFKEGAFSKDDFKGLNKQNQIDSYIHQCKLNLRSDSLNSALRSYKKGLHDITKSE
jgi:hypothetical protein